MNSSPSSSRFQRALTWAKVPLPATQTAAFLLVFGMGATAAWLPPQTRARLVRPLALLTGSSTSQAPLSEAHQTQMPALKPLAPHRAKSEALPAPHIRLARYAPVKLGAIPTFSVNSTGDGDDASPGDGSCQTAGGACTLRAAIEEANAAGSGIINFSIAGTTVHTISPTTQLPNIVVPVMINGYSQTGSSANTLTVGDNAKILIEVNGQNVTGSGAGLFLSTGSDGSTIEGLAVNNVDQGSGIVIGSSGNTIQGCFLGTDATGTIARGNSFNGVAMNSVSNNLIGGAAANTRNLISGNGTNINNNGNRPGVLIIQGGLNNTIQNNYIGTDITGTTALGNAAGVQLYSQSTDTINTTGNIISGNLISGNGATLGFSGVLIDGPKTQTTTLQGNKIGTNAAGTAAVPNGGGLELTGASNNLIGGTTTGQGNLISGNNGSGLNLTNGANSNTVQGNLIGTNAAGTAALGNAVNGIAITNAGANVIGGTATGARNVVSGNGTAGKVPGILINVTPTDVAANSIIGNYAGTNAAGTAAIANGGAGIQVFSSADDNTTTDGTIITGNLLSGNGSYGANIQGPQTIHTVLHSNKMGTNAAGTAAIPNGLAGVQIIDASDNVIGSTSTGEGNLISGNTSGGAVLSTGANTNSVVGNLIGTDVTGLKALANGIIGVGINNGVNNTVFANTISGNKNDGIIVTGTSATGTVIVANKIGVGSDGTTALGNGGNGIHFSTAGAGHTVGDSVPASFAVGSGAPTNSGLGNIIANNTGAGVSIETSTSNTATKAVAAPLVCHRKSLLGNSIYNNGGLGITLGGSTTPRTNQPASNQGDSVTGPNALQNYPILTGTPTTNGSTVTITGTLVSAPSASFRIEFFANATADASGHGEGQTFIGYQNVATNASGNASFTTTLAYTGSSRAFSATATDTVGNTSEFSTVATATATKTATSTALTSSLNPSTFGQSVTFTATVSGASQTKAAGAVPTGTVTFFDGTSTLGTGTLNTSAQTTFTTSTLAVGTHPIKAVYNGSTTYSTSTSAVLNQVVNALPTLSINDVSVTEGNSGTKNATFTVTLSKTPTTAVTVNYATSSGTATVDTDYDITNGILTFAANTTTLTQTINVIVRGDTEVEPNETFFVNLSGATNATIADAQGMGTIVNDDSTTTLPTLSINDVSLTEGNSGTKTAVFTVTLSKTPTSAVTVGVSAANGTATSGSDYLAENANLTFAAGTTTLTQTYTVNIFGDTTVEPNETFFVNLANATNATIADAQGVGTIINDDTAPTTPTLSINDVSVTEGNTGTKNATFTVTLSKAATSAITVKYATANGTATAGSDYTSTSGTLTFAANTTALTQTINVPIIGDTVREADETFSVVLSTPTNATIGDGTGLGTITNDDFVADVQVTQTPSSTSVPMGSQVTFTLVVTNNGPDTAQTVNLTDLIPTNSTFVSSNPAADMHEGTAYVFNLGTLTSGSSKTVTVTVQAPGTPGSIVNSATVASSGATDPSAPNNGSSVTVPVTNGAAAYSFKVGKLINVGPYTPSLYHPGAHFVQDVTITNVGTAAANAPLYLALDGLPDSVTLVNQSGTDTNGSRYVTALAGGTLNIGQKVTVRVEFRLTKSKKPTFTPRVTSGTAQGN